MPIFSLMAPTHFDIDDAPLLEVVPAVLFEQAVRVAADVDPLWLPRGLHPGCRVDRVSEQAITRHLDTHHARGALTAVDTCLNVFYTIESSDKQARHSSEINRYEYQCLLRRLINGKL